MLAWALLLAAQGMASGGQPTEYQVKAAYLYNFGKFVQWPNTPHPKNDFFDICVLGDDPFGSVLEEIAGHETLEGKAVRLRRLVSAAEGSTCRILYIGKSEGPRLKKVLASLEREPVLTVSDLPEFTERGGMIQFVLADNKVRFEVNFDAAQRVHLVLSSQLLKVATEVRGNARRGD